VLCKQVAKALDLDFCFTNCVTQEYQLTGFTDAMGKFHETEFYKAFTQGGLFMLDEMDASIPETLVVLNAAIANRYFNFPAPIGYVEAHPNFRVIAAGNTYGTGADMNYVGRAQLDAASLNRFAMVKVDYSEAIENNCAGGDKELADFARDYRKAAKKAGVNVVVSYRDITRLAKMTKLLSLEEALETCLVKGLEKDNVNSIVNAITANSKYKTALKNLANTL
jgi:MoxR-like ATPase